jgi:hypothetical protein
VALTSSDDPDLGAYLLMDPVLRYDQQEFNPLLRWARSEGDTGFAIDPAGLGDPLILGGTPFEEVGQRIQN